MSKKVIADVFLEVANAIESGEFGKKSKNWCYYTWK